MPWLQCTKCHWWQRYGRYCSSCAGPLRSPKGEGATSPGKAQRTSAKPSVTPDVHTLQSRWDAARKSSQQPNHRKVELICCHCHSRTFNNKTECKECKAPLATAWTLLPQQWPPTGSASTNPGPVRRRRRPVQGALCLACYRGTAWPQHGSGPLSLVNHTATCGGCGTGEVSLRNGRVRDNHADFGQTKPRNPAGGARTAQTNRETAGCGRGQAEGDPGSGQTGRGSTPGSPLGSAKLRALLQVKAQVKQDEESLTKLKEQLQEPPQPTPVSLPANVTHLVLQLLTSAGSSRHTNLSVAYDLARSVQWGCAHGSGCGTGGPAAGPCHAGGFHWPCVAPNGGPSVDASDAASTCHTARLHCAGTARAQPSACPQRTRSRPPPATALSAAVRSFARQMSSREAAARRRVRGSALRPWLDSAVCENVSCCVRCVLTGVLPSPTYMHTSLCDSAWWMRVLPPLVCALPMWMASLSPCDCVLPCPACICTSMAECHSLEQRAVKAFVCPSPSCVTCIARCLCSIWLTLGVQAPISTSEVSCTERIALWSIFVVLSSFPGPARPAPCASQHEHGCCTTERALRSHGPCPARSSAQSKVWAVVVKGDHQ